MKRFDGCRGFDGLLLGIQTTLGLQLSMLVCAGAAFTQEDAGLIQRPCLNAIKACVCHEGAYGQGLLIPGAGKLVVQVGMQFPARAIGPCLQGAAQVGVWPPRHEQCCIDMAQICLGLLHRLCQPRANDGADIGGQVVVLCARRVRCLWGMRFGLDGELGCFRRQRAVDICRGGDGQRFRRLLRQCCLDGALQLGLQLHGGCGLELGLGFIQAAGITQAADLQLVVAAGVPVLAIQLGDGGLWWAFPDDFFDAYRYIQTHR